MKISKIKITNYRLLKDFSIDIKENLSLIVGKNNSGKTSFLSLLEKFLKNNQNCFSFDDFNLDFQKDIIKAVDSECSLLKEPKINLKIYIEYGDVDGELKNLPMVSLDSSKNVTVLSFDYILTKEKFEELKNDINESNLLEMSAQEFLLKFHNKYFEKKYSVLDSENEENSEIIDYSDVKKIINFKTIKAKRDVANEEGDNNKSNKILSKMSHRYFSNSDDPGEKDKIDLQKTLRQTDDKLTKAYEKTFKSVTDSIKSFGHAPEIKIKSILEAVNVLKDNTAVIYNENSCELPEDYNGLGYMNLFEMIFSLHIIFDKFKKKYSKEEPADINLIFIEEPEAHTHPQMQYIFIKNIKNILKEEKKELKSLQTIITTHSAHIVSQAEFDDIKYFLNTDKGVIPKNLSELKDVYGTDEDGERYYKFLKQYLTLHRSELFFADKIIFIEGDSERILLPAMMKKIDIEKKDEKNYQPLLSQNISLVEVGANAKVFDKFLDFLEIQTLVITDIDSVKPGESGRKVTCCVLEGEDTSNYTIKHFLPDKDFIVLKSLEEENKIIKKKGIEKKFISYQTEENGYHARSFEDSFIFKNFNFVKDRKGDFNSLKNREKFDETSPDIYDIANNCIEKKSEFAIEVLLFSDENYGNWIIPDYIYKGLLWLTK